MIGTQQRVGQTTDQAGEGRGLKAHPLHRVVGQGRGCSQGDQGCQQPETLQHQEDLVRARCVVDNPAGVLTGERLPYEGNGSHYSCGTVPDLHRTFPVTSPG